MKVILDTDILSMFAKIDELKLLGVTVFSLQSILKSLWKGKLKSKNVVREIIQRMKKADNLEVSKEVEKEIFGEN